MTGSRLLTAFLETTFRRPATVIGAPLPALGLGWQPELDAARDDLLVMKAHYNDIFATGRRPVTALSRCAVALSTLPVVARYRPDAVVVWFDAHADINTPHSTTTGYLGGLALSGPLGLWDSGLGAGLGSDKVILAGTRDIDEPEQQLIADGFVTLVRSGINFTRRLRNAIDGRPVYMHLDCDVLDPGLIPTDYRVENGLSFEDLYAASAVLAESEIIGIEIGELEADSSQSQDMIAPLSHALTPVFDKVATQSLGC